jgi:hypothetical protein
VRQETLRSARDNTFLNIQADQTNADKTETNQKQTKGTTMKKLKAKTAALAAWVAILGVPAIVAAGNDDGRAKATQRAGQEAPPPALTADASCHNPCDDKFKLQAWVKDASGCGVKGIKVTFSYKLESGQVADEAETDSSGYAHLHLKLTPSVAPQDVPVEVTAQFNQGDETMKATTWFTPNYN